MTMGDRESAHRVHKNAVKARADALKRYGMHSVQYASAHAVLTDAISKLPKPLDANGTD